MGASSRYLGPVSLTVSVLQLPVPHRRRRLDVRQPGPLVQGHYARRQVHTVSVED